MDKLPRENQMMDDDDPDKIALHAPEEFGFVPMKRTDLPYRYSFDMLGESALTAADAQRYLDNYHEGIKSIGAAHVESADVFSAPGISVKLSALHPRYEYSHEDRVMAELVPAVLELARHAKDIGIGLTIDSEEAHRFEMWLGIFERIYRDPSLKGWDGLGVALQTYQRGQVGAGAGPRKLSRVHAQVALGRVLPGGGARGARCR